MNYERFSHPDKEIFLVDMTKERDHHFSELMKGGIAKYLNAGKRIAIMVNKKGFSHGVICYQCGHIPQCHKCSVSLSYHKTALGGLLGICHLCKTQYLYPQHCEQCGSRNIAPYGMAIQQVAEWITKHYQISPIIIESETVNSPNKIKSLLATLKDAEQGKGQVLL